MNFYLNGKGAPLAHDAYEYIENSENATCFYFRSLYKHGC